jgi:hypothetical protein
MLKLNTQLDKVIDRQNELADPEEQKSIAIELINDLKWKEASKLCAEQTKETEKQTRLDEEETHIRSELETLRGQLVKAADGEIDEAPASEEKSISDEPPAFQTVANIRTG